MLCPQINGVEMDGARHDQAVAMLTGHERFVRLVVEREVILPRNSLGSSPSPSPSPGPEKSPRLFGVPKPYTGLYNSNSYMANRPGYNMYRRPVTEPPSTPKAESSEPPVNTNSTAEVGIVNGTTKPEAMEAPRPAPRKLTRVQSDAESTDPTQVLPKPITNEEFQAMIPTRFLQPSPSPTQDSNNGPTVTVTIKQPDVPMGDIEFPPSPTAIGKVTETITKSTFTETVVTRVTDNKQVLPVIIEVSQECLSASIPLMKIHFIFKVKLFQLCRTT